MLIIAHVYDRRRQICIHCRSDILDRRRHGRVAGASRGQVALRHAGEVISLFDQNGAMARRERGDADTPASGKRIDDLSAWRRIEADQLAPQLYRFCRQVTERIPHLGHLEDVLLVR